VFVDEFTKVKADRDKYRKCFLTIEQISFNEPMSDERYVSSDIEKLIFDEIHLNGEQKPNDTEIALMVATVAKLCDNFPYLLINEIQEKNQTKIPKHLVQSCFMHVMLIRATLNSQRSLRRMNMQMLQNIITRIKIRHILALVPYGTAIGLLAAMSFSEPFTQYMLDAHHRSTAGGTSMNTVTEVKEILSAKKKDKLVAPSMHLFVYPQYETPSELARIANHIEMTKLSDFVRISQIFYEKFGSPVHVKYVEEAKMIQSFRDLNPLLKPPEDLLKWCIRFVLNKSQIIYKSMTLENIVTKLRETFPDLYIVYTAENAPVIILRIYIRNTYFKSHVEQDSIEELRDTLLSTVIRGVSGIRSAIVTKTLRTVISADGSIGQPVNRLCIKTLGTNISGVIKIAEIDPKLIQTDAIEEIQQIYGIEAARQKLINAIKNLGEGGLNYRHTLVYVDEMTCTGKVTSIEKQGLSQRETNNVLLRMGYSSPIQTLEEAGVNSMEDPVQGITSPLLVGDIPLTIGTAYNSFYINENIVKRNTVRPDDWLDAL
jgi:hypothetical protein